GHLAGRLLDGRLGSRRALLLRPRIGARLRRRPLARLRRRLLGALRLRRRLGRRRCAGGARRGALGVRLREHLALVDPHLDADHAVGRLRLAEAVVDVGAQRVQRHPALAVPLGARDLDAVQPSGAHDLDALRPQAHGVLHRALHGAAEHDALLELLGDGVGDELRVDLRLADLLDVDVHLLHAHQLPQLGLERLDLLALLADHDPGPGGEAGAAGVPGPALDEHAPDQGVRELALEVLAHLDVLGEHRREVAAVRVPARTPVPVDGEPESDGVDFLTHELSSVAYRDEDVAGLLGDAVAAPLGA